MLGCVSPTLKSSYATQIIFNIANEDLPRVITAFTVTFNYQETIIDENGDEVPNPETKAQFTKRMWIKYGKDVTRNYEDETAHEALPEPEDVDVE